MQPRSFPSSSFTLGALAALAALAPLAALAALAACNTTEYVDVPYDGGAGPSSSSPDGSADLSAEAAPDAAPDAHADAKIDDGKCHPSSSVGLEKATYAPPTGGYQALCTDAQITAYVSCKNGDTAACAQIDADGGASCRSCIETNRSAPAWGPVVLTGSSYTINEAGCGALANADTGTTGCGQGLADYTACLQFTCGDQCPGDEYFDCATEARGTECKTYVSTLKSSCTADVGSCFAQATDTTTSLVTRIIKRFCGSP